MTAHETLRVLAFEEAGQWVGQGLEYDIGAQAPDLEELKYRLQVAIRAEHEISTKETGVSFHGIGPAPRRFFERWDERRSKDVQLEIPLP